MTDRDRKFSAPLVLRMRESNGQTYVFVRLERTGGVMIYDISNPSDAAFVNHCDQPCNKLCWQTPVRFVLFCSAYYTDLPLDNHPRLCYNIFRNFFRVMQ